MEAEAYGRVSLTQRTLIVAGASAADMVVNFPLWICAKCVSAGIPLPGLRNIYKGSGSLYCAMGPLTIVEDRTTAVALDGIGDRVSPEMAHCASACISCGVAGLAVGCQIEGCITRAHATGETVLQATRSTYARGGLSALLFPYGALMIMAREVCRSRYLTSRRPGLRHIDADLCPARPQIPYAGCLFFLSGQIRAALHGEAHANSPGYSRSYTAVAKDVGAAALTATIAGPLSHVPSVIAAHQQVSRW